MERLKMWAQEHGGKHQGVYWDTEQEGPRHSEVPYAFKAYALQRASQTADVLLWADACILPIRDMEPLWQRIERDGYWFSKNGWSNYDWTADSAYPDLFPEYGSLMQKEARVVNFGIPHVVATSFGVNVRHEKGAAFLREYFRLASTTKAFCGPWINRAHAEAEHLPQIGPKPRTDYCGPSAVRGHRHDQTAASVIAWRLGMELTSPPDIFAYPPARDQRTILLADGAY